ncbi:probable protein S-acyltransferase 12 isoform X2 [Lycium ferocissimum]|uniref:probable protein S-acyltransferase 12 isoform X2 n=1 Tax=Lycium ferocissimum TaxID=112874 RepID=UPI002814BA69|nr:probable protein S-acyltransferase 12 isoform X2 [Lycium ferocissimum]
MDLNPFKLCSGLKVLGYFMILIVFAIVALSYYAVVVLTWGPHLLDGGFTSFLSFVIIITFHILLVLLMWSYIKVVIQDPGSVPENWKLVSEQNIEEGNSVALSDYASIENPTPTLSTDQIERRQSQSRGYCSKCHNGKPPRCHHCSVCQRCVLKMDHHCIWVVNCVGARNYKFFLLFVMYTFLTTTLDTLVLLPSFIKFFRQAMNHSLSPGNIAVIFLVFVLNLAFSLSLLCFVIMHASLLSSNTTSVEVYEKKKTVQWKYDLGWKRNFEQVFGANKALWFFPLFSKKDLENIPALHGLEFPTRSDAEE